MIRLESDQIKKSEVIKSLLGGYIADDPRIREFLLDQKKQSSSVSKTKAKKLDQREKRRNDFNDLITLPEKDIKELYDVFDEDFPD